MGNQPFNVLGLSNGSIKGNSEILLKAALQSLQSSSPRPTKTSWIHIPSVLIPRNPKPLKCAADISLGNVKAFQEGAQQDDDDEPDDRYAVLDAILEADAIIFATPVYTRQPPGFLKAVIDRILGPFTDAAFVKMVLERKKAGDPKFQDQFVDARVLKPRMVGFLVVGGSSRCEWSALALPTLHQLVHPIHAKVVDQVVLAGHARAGSVSYKNDGQAVERARLLGRRVASQMGKHFDQAIYLGDEPEGACPHCHLAQMDFLGGNKIRCTVCGQQGIMVVADDVVNLIPAWSHDVSSSCMTMEGKELHIKHIHEDGMEEGKLAQALSPVQLDQLERLLEVDIPMTPLPSRCYHDSDDADSSRS